MAKGFSFVLVTVVMIMMIVFGMLSLSSAGADLRLSQKAAETQQVYYALDSRGESLRCACAQADVQASAQAESFMNQKLYEKALPSDFYVCLRRLAANPGTASSTTYNCLTRGIFFYELQKQLADPKGDLNITVTVDQTALASALSSGGANKSAVPILSVHSVIISKTSPQNSLDVTLTCSFGDFSAAPQFSKAQWQSAVSSLEINDSQTLHLWNGK